MSLDLDYKKIGVFGFSPRTGLEVVKYLSKYDVEIIVADSKTKKELKPLIKKCQTDKLKFDLGSDGSKLLETELIILSPGVPYDLELLKKARKKGIETISEIEFAIRRSQAEIIAVTGTNGKTTTVELLAEMLADFKNKSVKLAGNIGIPFISIIDDLKPRETVILELSSFQLEAVKDFRAKIALYLNYSPDHLDRHHSEENYKKAKKNIFANQTENDYAILNFDDQYLFSLKDELKGRVLGVAEDNKAADLLINADEAFYIKDNLKLVDFKNIDLPGAHNRSNIAFAALASYLAGQELEKIQKAAENYHLKDHRMETVTNSQQYLIINDSKATNPASTIKAIQSIEKKIILIAGGQDRNADFSSLAKEIEKKVETLILFGETAAIIADYLKKTELEIIKTSSLEKAVKIALKSLAKDKALLLSPACPSWDMFSSYKERGNLFKKTVLESIE